MSIIAYDLDGVIMPLLKRSKPYKEQTTEEKREFEQKKIWHYIHAPLLIKPKEDFFLITSRQEKYRKETEGWLKKHRIYPKEIILMNDSLTFNHIFAHKYKYLIERGIEVYYEDDEKLIKKLQKKILSLKIIYIERTPQTVITEQDITIEEKDQKKLF